MLCLWWSKRKKDKKTNWHIILADKHQYKRREHSEDQFSAPKTIYFTLLSSLVAFPAICQQFLSAKDTHLASKRNDKGYPAPNPRSLGLAPKIKLFVNSQRMTKANRTIFQMHNFGILESKWLACEDICWCFYTSQFIRFRHFFMCTLTSY